MAGGPTRAAQAYTRPPQPLRHTPLYEAMKFSTAVVTLASVAYLASPVLAQDGTPERCKAPCESIQKIEACNDEDMSCVCGDQILKDSQDCRKCVTDSGVSTSLVPGFNEILTAHAEVCKAGLEALAALTSTSATSTSDPNSSSTSPAQAGGNKNSAATFAHGVEHLIGLGAGLALASLL
ncbi:hypothetical protein FA13DRAFT_1729227 [Coprinellus micaceus]|uniref:Uncharacterized protein n=1 Tax=Coprinellus micaceus TaxID=71717 RepID=A0A4Y7TK99_COPMI|nr:hypothetical protein FA13DRAFT_1729227 [Coprinellus micaceus]